MSKISKGYRLTVTSWENDADNYSSITKDGFTKEQMTFLVAFIKLFYSKHGNVFGQGGNKGHGNLYEPTDAELDALAKAFVKVVKNNGGIAILNTFGYEIEEEEITDSDSVQNLVVEIHSDWLGSGEFHTRVLDTYVVEYVHVDVELEEVTTDFQ